MLRTKLIPFLLFFSAFLFLFLVGESSLRMYHLFKYGRPLFSKKGEGGVSHIDEELGWRCTINYIYTGKKRDASGRKYDVHIKTNEYGFRIFGNPTSNKIKIFFLGDSFTHAVQVSNDKTYYGIISSNLDNIEVFAYGGGGYGSLQEFMILDEFIDIIKPNIIVGSSDESVGKLSEIAVLE